MIIFTVGNTRVEVGNYLPAFISALDQRLRYRVSQADHIGAVQTGVWDGWIKFVRRPRTLPPWFNVGLLDYAVQLAQQMGFPFTVVDERIPPSAQDLGFPDHCGGLTLRPYQEEAVAAMLAQPMGVLACPPRGGKTATAFELVRRLDLPTLWVAPTSEIVEQTVRRGREYFGDDKVQAITSNEWDGDVPLHVVTSAGALKMTDPDYWRWRQCLILDEAHHYVTSNTWGKHLLKATPHIVRRYGLTGTYFRTDGIDMALHAMVGMPLYSISSQMLVEQGHLAPAKVCFWVVKGPRVGSGGGFVGGFGKKGLIDHEVRTEMSAQAVKALYDRGKNVVVLVWQKRQGYKIRDQLVALGAESSHVEFISTDRHKERRGQILKAFREHGDVKVLIGTSLLGEGVDLPSADALVYAKGGKSGVSHLQGVYRVCTASPGKDYGVIVDFADKHCKKLLDHSRARYRALSADPLFSMAYVDGGLEEFCTWLDSDLGQC